MNTFAKEKRLFMYYISKRLEISGAHYVTTDRHTKCEALHGHNWTIVVHCKAEELDEDGMVVDFTEIKRIVHGQLDHKNLNEVLPFNPTAENIAKWVCDQVPHCYKVEVSESPSNMAIYEK